MSKTEFSFSLATLVRMKVIFLLIQHAFVHNTKQHSYRLGLSQMGQERNQFIEKKKIDTITYCT